MVDDNLMMILYAVFNLGKLRAFCVNIFFEFLNWTLANHAFRVALMIN